MPEQNLEHEAKFVITAPGEVDALNDDLSDLVRALSLRLEPAGVRSVTDTYLDTPAFELLRAGLALRLRTDGDSRRIGLKQVGAPSDTQDGIQRRMDIEFPLETEQPGAWPAELRELLDPHVAKLKSLRPIVQLHQTRSRHLIFTQPPTAGNGAGAQNAGGDLVATGSGPSAAGEKVVEWSVDEVQIHRPDAGNGNKKAESPAGSRSSAGPLHELEIERLSTSGEIAFQNVVRNMGQSAHLAPTQTSKLERALDHLTALQHGVESIDIAGAMSLPEACRLIVHAQCNVMLCMEHRVRRGDDVEAVHDMRVAIRRARAALRLLGDGLRSSRRSYLQNELKQLGNVLGRKRDLDVALENLKNFRKELPKPQRKQLNRLRQSLEQERRRAQEQTLVWLQGSHHRKFMVELLKFCTSPGKGVRRSWRASTSKPKITPTRVDHTLPSIILNCFESVRAYETVLHAEELPPLETFHALRIQAKYFRYSLEFTRHLLGEPGEALIAQLRDFQDQLGLLNDASVERERLASWLQELPDDKALSLRLQAVDRQIAELSAAIPGLHERFVGPVQRELLGRALARI